MSGSMADLLTRSSAIDLFDPPPPLAGVRLALVGVHGTGDGVTGQLSSRLVELGAEVTVFCEDGGPLVVRPSEGARFESVGRAGAGVLSGLLRDVRALHRSRWRFDVVHLLGCEAAFATRIARSTGTEVWSSVDPWEASGGQAVRTTRSWSRWMQRLVGRRVDRLLFESEASSRAFFETYGGRVPHEVLPPGVRVPDGVDPLPLGPLRLTPAGYFLTPGPCRPGSGLEEIIEGHRRSLVRQPLVVMSHPDEGGSRGKGFARYEGALVRFQGARIRRSTLSALRAHSRGYIQGPSCAGGVSGLVAAMAHGAPILAHDDRGNREVLGDAALYFSDAASLESRLTELSLCDAEARAAFGEEGRERAARHHGWDVIAEHYAALLLEARSRIRERARAY